VAVAVLQEQVIVILLALVVQVVAVRAQLDIHLL